MARSTVTTASWPAGGWTARVGLGVVGLEWRMVVNGLDVPSEGPPVSTELTELSDREAVGIHGLLGGLGGSYPATRSTVHPGTTLALTRYSMVTNVDADLLRVAVFDALWVKGLDKGDASAPGEFGCPTAPPSATLQWWHDEWLGFDRPTVPTMAVSGVPRRCVSASWSGLSSSASLAGPAGEVGRSCPRTSGGSRRTAGNGRPERRRHDDAHRLSKRLSRCRHGHGRTRRSRPFEFP